MNDHILQATDLSKRFGGVTAVSELSFTVPRGCLKGVVGPNGAGKTTLFNLLSGVLPCTTGHILLDGISIEHRPAHQRFALGISRTFQNLQIFEGMSVLENVMVGCARGADPGVWRSLFRTGRARADERALRQSAEIALASVGLEARAADPATDLSFGERKLLEIARAIGSKPRLLLLDEPAAGVSFEDVERIGRLIRSLNDTGITILLVEHNMRLVMEVCHEVLVLNFGRRIADALPAAILQNKEVIAAYLGDHEESLADADA
jgi:branched-chain amino acid transport system ATP-binding protein